MTRHGQVVKHTSNLIGFGRMGSRDLLIDRDLGDVNSCPAAEKDQSPDRGCVFLQFGILLSCLLLSSSNDGGKSRKELDRLRITPLFLGQFANVVDFRTED